MRRGDRALYTYLLDGTQPKSQPETIWWRGDELEEKGVTPEHLPLPSGQSRLGRSKLRRGLTSATVLICQLRRGVYVQ